MDEIARTPTRCDETSSRPDHGRRGFWRTSDGRERTSREEKRVFTVDATDDDENAAEEGRFRGKSPARNAMSEGYRPGARDAVRSGGGTSLEVSYSNRLPFARNRQVRHGRSALSTRGTGARILRYSSRQAWTGSRTERPRVTDPRRRGLGFFL